MAITNHQDEQNLRTESDLLGEQAVPAEAFWGIHTKRAVDNFSLSGLVVSPVLIKALLNTKKACALANAELGYLEAEKAKAVIRACEELINTEQMDKCPIDALQGGAGTSTNMYVNEIIANKALEIMGCAKAEYQHVHPVEDINLHQSTNDVYPTALKISLISGLRELSRVIAELQNELQKKENEFSGVLKISRTQMQHAVPMILGSEFAAFAEAFARDRWRTFKCEERLRIVNIGGTAIGTGLTAPRDYIFLVIEKLREVTELGLTRAENAIDATANADVFVEVSAILKANAANLLKAANDIRMMHFLGEVSLEKLQAGSSIMPGKVNPVACEAVMQAGMKVMANDIIVSEAVSRGTFQICEFLPLVAQTMLESLFILKNANALLRKTAAGISACPDKCAKDFDKNAMIITAFLPVIGYEKATKLVNDFYKNNHSNMKEFLKEHLGNELVEKVLSPQRLLCLGFRKDEDNT